MSERHHGFLMLERRLAFLNGLISKVCKDLHKVVGGPAVVAVCETHVEADSLVSAAKAAGIAEQHEIRIAAFDNRGAIVRETDDVAVPA